MKCKIVQPGPDLSSPGVGALWPPLEEVWRRPEPDLVHTSGYKNSSLGQGTVSHWSACQDG